MYPNSEDDNAAMLRAVVSDRRRNSGEFQSRPEDTPFCDASGNSRLCRIGKMVD